jgi:hypothetical protein
MADHGQTTGNVPVEAVDPGGTHKAPTGDALKKGPGQKPGAQPAVHSGDRNTAPNPDIHDDDHVGS